MNFTENDLKFFMNNIYLSSFENNHGGMGAPDIFSFWFILNKYKPKIVIESGVWNGISTQLIRKTLPDCKIICLDPINIPVNGYLAMGLLPPVFPSYFYHLDSFLHSQNRAIE